MKKIVFSAFLAIAAAGSYAQVLHNKIVKTSVVRPANSPILLNVHDAVYQKQKISPVVHANGGIVKMFLYNKTYTYPDNTKLNIRLKKSPNFAGSADFKPTTTPGGGGCDEPGAICNTSTVTVTASTTDFMNNNYSAQAAHIYPGAIYTYDHLYDGSFREETGPRNPIIIGSDNKNAIGRTFDTVATPTQFTVSNAVADLYSRFPTNAAANGSTASQIFESSNSSDLNIKVGAGGSGYGFSFDYLFNSDHKEQHVYLTIDVRKILFTISVNRPVNGYFKTPPPVGSPLTVISSVSYGVRILANLELTLNSESDLNAISASYNGYGVQANADLNLFSSSSAVNNTINAYVVGGASSDSKIAFDKSQLQEQINAILQNANYQNAQPISYELFDMDGDVIGGESVTDRFSRCVCVPSGANTPLQSVFATVSTDYNKGDNKDGDTHYSIGLFDQSGRSVASFHDDSNNDEYVEGSDNQIQFKVDVPVTRSDFSNGGKIHINVAPNGHDTWNIGAIKLSLQFQDDPKVEVMTFSGINMSQDKRDADLAFDGTFKPR